MEAKQHTLHKQSGSKATTQLSVLVPVYNERDVLSMLYERLTRVLNPLGIAYEIVLVDDGSKDGSGIAMLELAALKPFIKVVRLSRNFGKEAALTAGLQHVSGEAVIIMDADLQDPPELIPSMLEAWQEGYDVVTMRRTVREGESWFKRFSAHRFYRILNSVSDVDIPVDTGDFRLMSRKAIDAINQLNERNRYMKGLFAWIGLPTKVIEYKRHARAAGVTKWNYTGLTRLAFEGITSFSIAPLRLTMAAGILTALIGLIFALWIVVKTTILGETVAGYPSLISIITMLGGVQLISVGLLGEYVGKTYFEAKQRPVFLVRDVVQSASLVKDNSFQFEIDGLENSELLARLNASAKEPNSAVNELYREAFYHAD
ncbi:MAG: glycosyltransferase family 2 protein [Alcaligenaceae bacterium]|jgi:glycosyltransferase involved in cell wall biosynthesis|nr:glycosyltransferase family 2 protein [Alcaligenaceae bacterium]